jgi:hypothetical protein
MMALPAERCKIDYGDRSAIPSEPPSLARPSAALASDGGGEGWPIPLVGLSMVRRQGATPPFLRSKAIKQAMVVDLAGHVVERVPEEVHIALPGRRISAITFFKPG